VWGRCPVALGYRADLVPRGISGVDALLGGEILERELRIVKSDEILAKQADRSSAVGRGGNTSTETSRRSRFSVLRSRA